MSTLKQLLRPWSIALVSSFKSAAFIMVEVDRCPKQTSPTWAKPFNKMQGMSVQPGQLAVQIPSPEIAMKVLGRNLSAHNLLCFMDAVFICRKMSPRVGVEAFSNILGESEAKIATDLHAMLIAGLGILSIAGTDGHIDLLVKAILGEKLKDTKRDKSNQTFPDWLISNRIRCSCISQFAHRPLSPIAAAKAVGMDIWRIREDELVTRVWDLESDTLVAAKKTTEVILISHTWGESEVDYLQVKGCKGGNEDGISKKSTKLEKIHEALRRYTKYVWLDTICIDKSNLTELDEAIRSMHKWYKNAAAVVVESGT